MSKLWVAVKKFAKHFVTGAVAGATATVVGGDLTVEEILAGALAGGLAGVGLNVQKVRAAK